jgi:hypothetical protein
VTVVWFTLRIESANSQSSRISPANWILRGGSVGRVSVLLLLLVLPLRLGVEAEVVVVAVAKVLEGVVVNEAAEEAAICGQMWQSWPRPVLTLLNGREEREVEVAVGVRG